MIKVSIVIPVYNVQEYLTECMESVIGQTLKEIEIICVNDGSTDGSPEILERFAARDKRIVLIHRENGGYGCAVNEGMKRAAGEYVGIVEPDDYVPPDMYQDLYRTAKEYELDFVKADFYRFTTGADGEREFVYNETPGASFQDNGFWIQTFIYGERAMIIDRPYYRNRRDNPASSVNSREKVYCINIEYDYIRGILTKNPDIWERFKYMYWFKKYHNYMGTLWRIGEEYQREYVVRFSEELRRGIALGEVKREVFSDLAWSHIQGMAEDPERYYICRVYAKSADERLFERINELELKNQKLKDEIAKVRSSKSFRLGRLLLYLPGKFKKLIRGKL